MSHTLWLIDYDSFSDLRMAEEMDDDEGSAGTESDDDDMMDVENGIFK